jgi:NAD(P)-dependent dehydrogenase (short-subunit alcohol dehydrogenase family)
MGRDRDGRSGEGAVAALVRFLVSPDASAITGQTYNICGGQTLD